MTLSTAVATARAARTLAPRRRTPRAVEPLYVQRDAGVALAGLLQRAASEFAKRADRLREAIERDQPTIAYAVLEVAFREGEKFISDAGPAVAQFAAEVADHNRRELGRQLKAAIGVSPHLAPARPERVRRFAEDVTLAAQVAFRALRDQLARHVGMMLRAVRVDARLDAEFPIEHALEHVNLISGLTKLEREELAAELAAAHASGDLTRRTLEVVLRTRFEMTDVRARAIARDQVAKLNGQINADRQVAIGVTHFRWKTRQDRRVRPKHKARRDKVYAWEDPPDGEIPGQPINCRCHADPVVDNIAEILGGPPRRPGSREAPTTFRPT